jgi:hypothetical protein
MLLSAVCARLRSRHFGLYLLPRVTHLAKEKKLNEKTGAAERRRSKKQLPRASVDQECNSPTKLLWLKQSLLRRAIRGEFSASFFNSRSIQQIARLRVVYTYDSVYELPYDSVYDFQHKLVRNLFFKRFFLIFADK